MATTKKTAAAKTTKAKAPERDPRLAKIVEKAEEPEDRYADFSDYLFEETGERYDPTVLQIAIHAYKHYQVSDRNRGATAERRAAKEEAAAERLANREARAEAKAEADAAKKAAAAAKKAEAKPEKSAAAASKPLSKAAAARAAKPTPTAKRTTGRTSTKGKVTADAAF